jgi:hypothetical protein
MCSLILLARPLRIQNFAARFLFDYQMELERECMIQPILRSGHLVPSRFRHSIPFEKEEKVLIDEEKQLPSSTLISPSEVTATGSPNPLVRVKDDEQKELPVSLEIVRYLPSADIHRIRMPHSLGT